MAGYGMKRPHPGDWIPFPPPPPEKRGMPMGDAPYWPPAYDGGYGRGGGYGGWGGGGRGGGNVDFTDDYEVFYGPARGGRGRGSQRGWGRGGSQRGGNQSKPDGASTQNGSSGTGTQPGSYPGNNRGGPGNRGRGGPWRGAKRGGQRGMPPNMFGRGRGRGKPNKPASVVPPVHSLAKAKPSYPDLANMSVAEKLHRFCLFLRGDDSIKINSIQTIMNAVTSTKLGMKIDYEADELTRVAGMPMYTGVLRLDGVFLARGVGANKKELKQEVFLKAYNVMLSKTVAEIYNLHDPGITSIRNELDEQMAADKEEKIKREIKSKEISNVDMAEAFETFVTTVKNMEGPPENPIMVIEQSITMSHLLVKHEYRTDAIHTGATDRIFVGEIVFGDIVVGRGSGKSKKGCRKDTYLQTLRNIMEKSMEELKVSVPPATETSLASLQSEHVKLTKKSQQHNVNLPLEEKLANLIRTLIEMPNREGVVNPIDVSAASHGLTPLLVYRTASIPGSRYLVQCELYLDRIHLATSEGKKQREVMGEAYKLGWEVLTNTDVETLMTQHKRITDEELKDPKIIDVITKGGGKTIESNTCGLKRNGYNLDTVGDNSVDDLVIIEHSDWAKDRAKNAFCTLKFSTTKTGHVLTWEIESVTKQFRNVTCKCSMYIQKKQVGWSYGMNRMQAKNLASADALFKLYETQPVIKVINRNDEDKWIPWESFVKEAEETATEEEKAAEPCTDNYGNPLPTPAVQRVVKEKLAAFAESKEGQEFIIGPGIGTIEIRAVRNYLKPLELRCDNRQHQGKPYLLIYQRMGWPELAACLQKRGEPYGKYELVPVAERPKHKEITNSLFQNPKPIETMVVDVEIGDKTEDMEVKTD